MLAVSREVSKKRGCPTPPRRACPPPPATPSLLSNRAGFIQRLYNKLANQAARPRRPQPCATCPGILTPRLANRPQHTTSSRCHARAAVETMRPSARKPPQTLLLRLFSSKPWRRCGTTLRRPLCPLPPQHYYPAIHQAVSAHNLCTIPPNRRNSCSRPNSTRSHRDPACLSDLALDLPPFNPRARSPTSPAATSRLRSCLRRRRLPTQSP